MYSFGDPKSLISKTDKSESPHTSTNYKSKDSDMVESSMETGTGDMVYKCACTDAAI